MRFDYLKMIIFDFDGVFTDNKVVVSEDGKESVVCYRSDGIGLGMIREIGIDMLILSKEKNPVVQVRAKKLQMACINGCDDKLSVLKEQLASKGYQPEDTAYLGNDINDIECMRFVGYPICVNDAYPEVKEISKLILSRNGGEGAVRELCDLIIKQKNESGK